jgi:hypothetical protein
MKTRNEELKRRSKFRYECLRRSPGFEELVKRFGLWKAEIWDRQNGGYSKETRDYLAEKKTIMDDRLLKMMGLSMIFPLIPRSKNPDEIVESLFDLPSIEVLSTHPEKRAKKFKFKSLEESKEKLGISPRDFLFGFYPDVERDNTIIIKIHLDRKKTDIGKDIRSLLDTLENFGKLQKLDNRFPLEDFERYFKAYDLRRKQKSWTKIAREIFPEEDLEGAKRKVRHYHDQVNRWIREEVWWQ